MKECEHRELKNNICINCGKEQNITYKWFEPNDKCTHQLKQDFSHYELYECIKCNKKFIRNTPGRIITKHILKGLK